MIPVQIKVTPEDESEKHNDSEPFLSATYKSSEIGSTKDFINAENIENEDNAWEWICENIGIIQEVTRDGYCGYSSFIGACNHIRRLFAVNLPQMRSTKKALLNM